MPAGRLNVFSFGRIVMRRFVEDRCMQIASSLTFTSLLSIVPFVTIALTMIAAFPVFGELTGALQTFILHNMRSSVAPLRFISSRTIASTLRNTRSPMGSQL